MSEIKTVEVKEIEMGHLYVAIVCPDCGEREVRKIDHRVVGLSGVECVKACGAMFNVTIHSPFSSYATLTEQLAEAKAKNARFEAMLGSVSELCFDDPSADICHNDNGTWTAVTHRPRLSLNGPHPDALTAFEAIQEGRDG